MNTENPSSPLDIATEIIPPSALESISRAETDILVATARRYPRQLSKVKSEMISFATLDQDTAEACFYKLPRGGKNIEGPSVRLAEIAVSCYGNLSAGSRIVETVTSGDNPHVTVQAYAIDLEKNVRITIEKRRRIVGKKSKGGVIDEDDINLAANAGAAIAFRDAVFKVVPGALIKPVFEQAKAVAIGNAATLEDRRARALERFAKMGVDSKRVLASLGKAKIDEIVLDDLETLFGIHTAIKDGQMTIEEAFTPKTITEANPAARRSPIAEAAAKKPDKPAEAPVTPVPTETPAGGVPEAKGEPAGDGGPTKDELLAKIRGKIRGKADATDFVRVLMEREMIRDAMVLGDVPLDVLRVADDVLDDLVADAKGIADNRK